MNIARELFESKNYPDRFPEFKRLMAFCDANNLTMSFFDEAPYIGIRVHRPDGRPITRYGKFTIYYSTMDRKVRFLDFEDWDEGMGMLSKTLGDIAQKDDEDIIMSLGSTIG